MEYRQSLNPGREMFAVGGLLLLARRNGRLSGGVA